MSGADAIRVKGLSGPFNEDLRLYEAAGLEGS